MLAWSGRSRRQGWRLGGSEGVQLRTEHPAEVITVNELDVVLAGGRLLGGPGELAAGDDDGASGVLVDLDAKQFVHGVVGDLLGVPVLGLDQHVFIALA